MSYVSLDLILFLLTIFKQLRLFPLIPPLKKKTKLLFTWTYPTNSFELIMKSWVMREKYKREETSNNCWLPTNCLSTNLFWLFRIQYPSVLFVSKIRFCSLLGIWCVVNYTWMPFPSKYCKIAEPVKTVKTWLPRTHC